MLKIAIESAFIIQATGLFLHLNIQSAEDAAASKLQFLKCQVFDETLIEFDILEILKIFWSFSEKFVSETFGTRGAAEIGIMIFILLLF